MGFIKWKHVNIYQKEIYYYPINCFTRFTNQLTYASLKKNLYNKRIVLFDFDGTITYRDTLIPYLWYISTPVEFIIRIIITGPWLLAYAFGFISNESAKNRLLVHFLKGRSIKTIEQLSISFVNQKLPSLIRPEALEALNSHHKNNDICILISASPEIYVDNWAEKYPFDYVITTRISKNNHTYAGNINGNNCYGEEKVNRLKKVIPNLQKYHIISYGDSQGDYELFNISDEYHYKPFRN